MKHGFRTFLMLAAVAGMLACAPALAAEGSGSPVSVQLNGQELSFTDAVPQVRDQRTFLPFRAVFEAMGAQVDNQGEVITAVRGDRTLTMTIGSAQATVTEKGQTTPITMDVAPYVDNTTWRTYVPVRFAAQAFDCAVGWDQTAATAVIVDTEQLLDEVLAGKQFTYLEKLVEYSGKYNKGIWDMNMALEGNMAVMGMPVVLAGAAEGTVADSNKMDLTMDLKMDMTQFLTLMEQTSGEAISPEDRAVFDLLAEQGVGMTMRGDLAAGSMFMKVDLPQGLGETAGLETDAWMSMDLAALYQGMGMDYAELMDLAKTVDYRALVKAALSQSAPNDAVGGYLALKGQVEQLVALLADDAFVAEGNTRSTTFQMEEDGVALTLKLILTMDGDKVAGYDMGMDLTATVEEMAVTMYVAAGMNAEDHMEALVSMEVPSLMTMELGMMGDYTPGKTAPETQPPAGAKVTSLNDLMGQMQLQ